MVLKEEMRKTIHHDYGKEKLTLEVIITYNLIKENLYKMSVFSLYFVTRPLYI